VQPDGQLDLQLQSLPAPAAILNSKPILRMDDINIVHLASWRIEIPMFDGNGAVAGPVPVIFCEDPERMRTVLDIEVDSFGGDLNAFMKR
jgi:hypothetical protein